MRFELLGFELLGAAVASPRPSRATEVARTAYRHGSKATPDDRRVPAEALKGNRRGLGPGLFAAVASILLLGMPATAPAAQLTVSWADNSTNESGFRIERRVGTTGTFQLVATVGPNVRTYVNTGLTIGVTYCYRTQAYNAAGSSSYSNTACRTAVASPTVTINTTTPMIYENSPGPGLIVITRTGSTAATLTVRYSVSGTALPDSDYLRLPGTVTIPAGSASVQLLVKPIKDTKAEGPEWMTVSLTAASAYQVGSPGSASIWIGNVGGSAPVTAQASQTGERTRAPSPVEMTVGTGPADRDTAGPPIVTGAGPGATPLVHVFDGAGYPTTAPFHAFEAGFAGGVSVALGHVDGEPEPRIVVGSGHGRVTEIRTFDLRGAPIGSPVQPFGQQHSAGVRVAACDFVGDGHDTVVTGAGPGSPPWVSVWRLTSAGIAEASRFLAAPDAERRGLHVACGDVDGDGRVEVIVGLATGGPPTVRVFDLHQGAPRLLAAFDAEAPTFTGGVSVACVNLAGPGRCGVVTGSGPGGLPTVRVWTVRGTGDAVEIARFLAYDPAFSGGVTVATRQPTDSVAAQIVTTPGDGIEPIVRIFRREGTQVEEVGGFLGSSAGITGGITVTSSSGPVQDKRRPRAGYRSPGP